MSLSFPPFTPAVKQLLIANGAVFLLVAVLGAFSSADVSGVWVNVTSASCQLSRCFTAGSGSS